MNFQPIIPHKDIYIYIFFWLYHTTCGILVTRPGIKPVPLQLASLRAQLVKNLPAMQETLVQFLGQEDPWRRDRLPTPVFLVFPCGSAGKESAWNEGTWVRSLGLEDPLEKRKATHSSILTWRIPWTIQSMGSQRVGYDWLTFTFNWESLGLQWDQTSQS